MDKASKLNQFKNAAYAVGYSPDEVTSFLGPLNVAATSAIPRSRVLGANNASAYEATMPNNTVTALIKKYFPQEQWLNAYNVMKVESGGNPGAVGDNYPIRGQTIPSYGLFQIRALPGRPAPTVLLNPEENVKYAASMQAQQGWGPWTGARKLGLVP